MNWLFIREIKEYFTSLKFFVMFASFLFMCGLFFFSLLQNFNQEVRLSQMMVRVDVPSLHTDLIAIYFKSVEVVLLFIIPILCMGIFAEDRQRGTFEFLITSPLSVLQISLAKWLSIVSLMAVFVLGATLFPFMLLVFYDPEWGPIAGGSLGLLLFAVSFASLALAVCTPFVSQVLAGISSVVVLLAVYIIDAPFQGGPEAVVEVASYLAPATHTHNFYQGYFSSADVIYFFSAIVLGLVFTVRTLERERWR